MNLKLFIFLKKYKRFALILIVLVSLYILINWNAIFLRSKISVVYELEDTDYGNIWVFDRSDRRCLTFNRPILLEEQSCIIKSDPLNIVHMYIKVMLGSLFIVDDLSSVDRVLIIGLGGGVLPRSIQQLLPNVHLDVVEFHPKLPEITQEYFFLSLNEKTRIHVEDGFEFLTSRQAQEYDLIMIDAFNSDYIPSHFISSKFVKVVKKNLKSNGVVVINTFSTSISPRRSTEIDLYQNEFNLVYLAVGNGNRIIFGRDLQDATRENKIKFFEHIINSSSTIDLGQFSIDTNTIIKSIV